ncbi:MAG: heme exporter protein CcmB [Thermoanaerobaculaceae bacterium]|jgi:heme exporter protein B
MRASTLLSEILAVLAKELTAELRSRVALNAIGLFGLTTLIAVAYQIGPYQIQEQDRPHLLSALLWIILFFAATSGLSRVFVKEEDAHTAKTLRLAARPIAVLGGKYLFNLILLLALDALIVPLYCALMGYAVRGVGGLLLVLVTGAVALAATTTIVAAIIARASGSTTLFAILSVPLVLPLLVMLIQGTRAAAASSELAAVLPALQGIVSLGGAVMIVSVYLFPAVWHD